MDLKNELQSKLILLATTKIETNQKRKTELEKEINNLAKHADEIWSVGPDLFLYLEHIFQKSDSELHSKHKDVVFKPDDQLRNRNHNIIGTKISSIWNHGYQFYFKGQKQKSKGSSKDSFKILGKALGRINEDNNIGGKPKLIWHACGLRDEEDLQKSLTLDVTGNNGLVPLTKPKVFVDVMNKINSTVAFIVPDENEDTFNFAALTAMWKGIPTLVSSNSSVGKWLLKHSIPNSARATVNLTGKPEEDKKVWIKKIKQEIFDPMSNPKQWANELSQYHQKEENEDLWKVELSILNPTDDRAFERDALVSFYLSVY